MGWKMVKLNEIGFVQGGFAFPSTEYIKEGIPLIRISNIIEDAIELKANTVFVDAKYLKTKKDFIIEKDDVLIAMSGATTGKFGIYNLEIPSLLNQRVGRIKLNFDKIVQKYFYYFMFQIQNNILQNSYGAAIPNISPSDIASFQIPLPPLHTQQHIAAILDQADSLRKKDQQLLAKYDILLQSIFYEMFGDPVKNEKGWEKGDFSHLLNIDRKIINQNNFKPDYFYVGLEHIEKDTGTILDKIPVNNIDLKSTKFLFNSKHILYGKLRPYLNKVALPDFSGVCSTDILPILANEINANKYFIAQIIKQKHFVEYANSNSYGANLPRANARMIENYQTIFPPINLQNKFATIAQNIQLQKEKVKLQMQQSQLLFEGLLQKAFKGELVNLTGFKNL